MYQVSGSWSLYCVSANALGLVILIPALSYSVQAPVTGTFKKIINQHKYACYNGARQQYGNVPIISSFTNGRAKVQKSKQERLSNLYF
jgi:hypothetical protein